MDGKKSSIDKPQAPLAIVGIGCRLPGGVECWQDFWRLLEEGRDAIQETPSDRWSWEKFYASEPGPGKTQSRWGGYVQDIDQFDPQLFGIAPREAAAMDPQQRMLLEVAWRAVEDGGQTVEKIAGRNVSVFVGISSFDYAVAGLSSSDRGVIGAYSNTGGSSSIAANRISYCFDLRGPSVAVDTACSSSLVAVHMACESIWNGDSQMALAGGVNALILPDFYVAFSQLGVLAPDGRCKTFDARANGYVRSEGAGMVLLKPLADAMRDGDCIYAVIRATALNQDGRTPGLTVPSESAQAALVRTACARAGIAPAEIQYVEAHGTGTAVGDPIEANALASVLSEGRAKNQPCWVGSVKTNIGHLEAGAGMASLIKVALSLHHQRIPAHLHFENPNPAIDFEKLGLRVPTSMQPWHRQPHRTRLAGINGFGYGGANAHIIVEESPIEHKQSVAPENHRQIFNEAPSSVKVSPTTSPAPEFELPVILPLSARTQPALAELALDWANWFESSGSEIHVAEAASFTAHRRSHLECRATVCGTTREELIAKLRSLEHSGVASRSRSEAPLNIAFVCAGQGPQWWAMGRGLLSYCPAFREVIDSCGREFARYGKWSLIEELLRSEETSRMQQTHIAQPSLFAIQVGLAAVWKSWGIEPAVVVGHSVGEIAAAYISGSLTFGDACAVAFHRGRTMDLATSRGAMLAVGLSAEEIRPMLSGLQGEIAIAAINGPSSLTLSGAAADIERLFNKLNASNIFCRRLKVEYAFHSSHMDPARAELIRSICPIKPKKNHTELISTVTGKSIDGRELNAEYWWNNVRRSVLFADAMQELAERDCDVVIELGPHPVLAYSITECFQSHSRVVHTLPSLNRDQNDLQCLARSLGELYSLGADVRWSGYYTAPTRKLMIPNYPFQRIRCWSQSRQTRLSLGTKGSHPLLGDSTYGPRPSWEGRIDLRLQTYLAEHCVRGVCLYPAAAIIESALAAAREIGSSNSVQLERLRFVNPCVLAEGRAQWIETSYVEDRRRIEMQFRGTEDDEWMALFTADVSTFSNETQNRKGTFTEKYPEAFDGPRLYAYCQLLGLEYGPLFRGVQCGSRKDGAAWLEVDLKAPRHSDAYGVHPAILDACFHGMIAADGDFDHKLGGLYLPAEIKRVRFIRPVAGKVRCHVRIIRKTPQRLVADIDIFDLDGELLVSVEGFVSQRVHGGGRPIETADDLVYKYNWIKQELTNSQPSSNVSMQPWLVFQDRSDCGSKLVSQLKRLGIEVAQVFVGKTFTFDGLSHFTVDPESVEDFRRLLTQLVAGQQNLSNIVYLWGLDAPSPPNIDVDEFERSTTLTTLAPLYLIQAWENLSSSTQANLAIVTRGAQAMDGHIEPVAIAQTPLIGFGRVILSECGQLRGKLIDMSAGEGGQSQHNELLTELLAMDSGADSGEDEVAWRGGTRWVHRFVQAKTLQLAADVACQLPSRLHVGASAGVEELSYRTTINDSLAGDEVEVEVLATGLNFSDVMKALDLYPGLPEGPVALGAECCGRITRVGAMVKQWHVGDEVIAIAPGSFGTHVTVSQELIARKPFGLSDEQAAGIPIAFLTADYALNHCARIRAGESILIHSASGGVGLAAMQLAGLAGAIVYATAGNEEKRAYVRQMGARMAMDSRTVDFANLILAETSEEEQPGVDVILNSLPGEAISKGIGILRTGGRFLEIGKRDIYNDASLGLFAMRNNLSFFAIDLDQLFKRQPARMGTMLRELVTRFDRGELQPVLTKGFAADDTRTAFRFMQQGKHIGKVAVRYKPRPTDVFPGDYPPIKFDKDASYWIAGGLGGFGLEVARWMASRGAGTLVLSSRKHLSAPQTEALLAEFANHGTQIKILPTDITNTTSVSTTLQTIDRTLAPLRGVFHTAMILEDRMLIDLDRETLERVLRPKVLGGWILHRQTLNRTLDHFVLFSSLSSVFGHAGQANYSAANALLDGLSHYRRSLGLAGLTMNWGHLGEVGYLAEREQLGQRLERQGVLSFSVKQALECLEYAMQLNERQLSVLRIDWTIWRGLGITTRVSPRFAHLLRNSSIEENGEQNQLASAEQLHSAAPSQRVLMVEHLLRYKVASLLGMASEHIQRERSLLEMGLDSLMAVEMRNWVEAKMEIGLPIAALMRSASLNELVEKVCEIVGTSNRETANNDALRSRLAVPLSPITGQQASDLLEQLPALADGEVSQLLERLLRGHGN